MKMNNILSLSSLIVFRDDAGVLTWANAHFELHPDGRFEPQCVTDSYGRAVYEPLPNGFWDKVQSVAMQSHANFTGRCL